MKVKNTGVAIIGRPSDYSMELVKTICKRLSGGERLPIILSEENMPCRATFFNWKRDNKEFLDLYARVQQDKGELFIEEIDDTMEQLRKGRIDPSSANIIIQTLKWKASKFYPKMFGDKVEVDHSGSIGLTWNEIKNYEPEQKADEGT